MLLMQVLRAEADRAALLHMTVITQQQSILQISLQAQQAGVERRGEFGLLQRTAEPTLGLFQ